MYCRYTEVYIHPCTLVICTPCRISYATIRGPHKAKNYWFFKTHDPGEKIKGFFKTPVYIFS